MILPLTLNSERLKTEGWTEGDPEVIVITILEVNLIPTSSKTRMLLRFMLMESPAMGLG
jgi:hypothetical protein